MEGGRWPLGELVTAIPLYGVVGVCSLATSGQATPSLLGHMTFPNGRVGVAGAESAMTVSSLSGGCSAPSHFMRLMAISMTIVRRYLSHKMLAFFAFGYPQQLGAAAPGGAT
jgi:hypothetical protein